MGSYFSDLIDDAPVERVLEYNGQTKPVWVKRLTAGQRMKLQAGQVYEFEDGKAKSKIDMADASKRNATLIRFALCDSAGKAVFSQDADVLLLPDDLVEKLAAIASEVVNGGEEPGKG